MVKVLHLFGTAVLGRSKESWYQEQFLKNNVNLIHHPEEIHPILRDGLEKHIDELVEFINKNSYDWVFFGWEMFNGFKELWEHPKRKSRVLIYAQEQPQRLHSISQVRPYCDMLITSAPTFQEGTDGYIPFPIHTSYLPIQQGEKKNRVLLSGSFRQCRFELFNRILDEQPFDWSAYLLPSGIEWEPIGKSQYENLVTRHKEFTVDIPKKHGDYIPSLLKALSESRVFVDFTFNPYPELKLSQGHASLKDVLSINNYLGGYMPERVLDACYMMTVPVCFKNPAIEYCLGDAAFYYETFEDLIDKVNKIVRMDESSRESLTKKAYEVSLKFTSERIIEELSEIFKTGIFSKRDLWRQQSAI